MSKLFDDASLAMIPSAYKDGKLYSIRPTDGSGDFTFSRGSNLAATRVDVNGLIEKGRENRLLQSNQFDTTWSLTTGISVTSGQADKDGGTNAWLLKRADGSSRFIKQTISQSGVQSFSVYIKAESTEWVYLFLGGTTSWAYFDLGSGSVGLTNSLIDSSIEAAGNGFYRCTITASASTSEVRIYPAQGNGAVSGDSDNGVYIQDAQLEAGLVATDYIETGASTAQAGILEDMPRLDYSGGASCPALLLEPQRTNLITNSEYLLSGSGWNTNYMNREANSVVSPDGSQNATKITPTTDNQIHSFFKTSEAISGHIYTAFVKANGYDWVLLSSHATSAPAARGCFFYIADDGTPLVNRIGTHTSGNPSIEDYGNGWFRISIDEGNSPSSIYTIIPTPADETIAYAGDGTSGVYVYGFQREAGSYPTSYIPTYGSSVTRTNESASITNASSIIGQTQGTIFVDYDFDATKSNGGGSDNDIIHLRNASNDLIKISHYGDASFAAAKKVYLYQYYNSAYQAIISSPVQSTGRMKVAVVYRENYYALFVNGVKIGEDLNANVPSLDLIYLNKNTGFAQVTNPRHQAVLFQTALTDSECIALTTL